MRKGQSLTTILIIIALLITLIIIIVANRDKMFAIWDLVTGYTP